MFLSWSCATCLCRRLVRLVVWVSVLLRFGFRRLVATLSCVWVIQIQSIFDQVEANTSNQIMVINMIQNWSHMYSNHYRIIKCVGFEPIHCAINLNVASFSKVFNKFDYIFLSNVLLV